MAQVIKHSTKDFKWDFSCRKCHSQIAADASDVRTGYFADSYDYGNGGHKLYVKCPVCGCRENFVPANMSSPDLDKLAGAASKSEKDPW
jgi:hypothetical protein